MRKTLVLAGMASLLLASTSSVFAAGAASKTSPGTIVIVFKDGHRQSFNLSEIERVEFPASVNSSGPSASGDAAPSNGQMPVPRGRFVGKWDAGDGNGGRFYITLNENGTAHRSLNAIDGKWVYSNGEALITWDDGSKDAIRKVGNKFQKSAYEAGKSFTDIPDNVADAHNTSPRPI